jgi:hypothetical protein
LLGCGLRVQDFCSVRCLQLTILVVFATKVMMQHFGGKLQISCLNVPNLTEERTGLVREWFVKCIFVEGCCLNCWVVRKWSLSSPVRRSSIMNLAFAQISKYYPVLYKSYDLMTLKLRHDYFVCLYYCFWASGTTQLPHSFPIHSLLYTVTLLIMFSTFVIMPFRPL